jgi:hypothetical protein
MNTPYGSRLTSIPFAEDLGVATRLFKLAEPNPLSVKLNASFWGDPDIFKATNTAFPL